MKDKKCPYSPCKPGGGCFDYGSCDECEMHLLIARYERRLVWYRRKLEKAQKALENHKAKGERV